MFLPKQSRQTIYHIYNQHRSNPNPTQERSKYAANEIIFCGNFYCVCVYFLFHNLFLMWTSHSGNYSSLKTSCFSFIWKTAERWPMLRYFAQRDLNFFGPIPWQAAEIIGGLLSTESQTPKGTQYTGRWNFLCLISINAPTHFFHWGINVFNNKKLVF